MRCSGMTIRCVGMRCVPGIVAVLMGIWTLPATAQAGQGIEAARWLAGCWERGTNTRSMEEQWMAPRGNTMVGMNRSVRDGRLAAYELVIILADSSGLVYEAHPSGQPMARFPLAEASDTSLTFSNPDHDFPQRIGYIRLGTDSLLGWIDGMRGGDVRRVDFPFRRVPCPGGGGGGPG